MNRHRQVLFLMRVKLSLILLCLWVVSSSAQVLKLPAHTRVLFQGDSITDMNRGRTEDPNHILGHSYAFLIAARAGASVPQLQMEFFNRGISGNRVSDLLARWQIDTVDLRPDLLSILIGINDIKSDEPMDRFEADYDELLTKTHVALPKARIVVCEPFCLPTDPRKSEWITIQSRIGAAQEIAARLAKKHHAIFVPLQRVFDAACKRAPADHWIWDGIHPTYSGQQLLADQWVKVVGHEFKRRRTD